MQTETLDYVKKAAAAIARKLGNPSLADDIEGESLLQTVRYVQTWPAINEGAAARFAVRRARRAFVAGQRIGNRNYERACMAPDAALEQLAAIEPPIKHDYTEAETLILSLSRELQPMARLLSCGRSQSEAAAAIGVSRATGSRWAQKIRKELKQWAPLFG